MQARGSFQSYLAKFLTRKINSNFLFHLKYLYQPLALEQLINFVMKTNILEFIPQSITSNSEKGVLWRYLYHAEGIRS